jgi:cytochrome oxidase Cu insertion factor (SCO1/SenC/PrrC family)
MNIKNAILLALAITGGALFLAVQKHTNDDGTSFNQPMNPSMDMPAARYRAPDFTLVGLDNTEYALSDALGNVIVMTFWTTW